jgi:2,3-dihydroxy-p-cumate/2,3-dihydroxybenzoate 3,4-dioxygenase
MIRIADMQYVRLATRDVEHAVTFLTETVGLQLVRREDGRAYLRGDDRDHDICYFPGEPGNHVVGFKIETRAELEAAAKDLAAAGVAVERGTKEECEERRVLDLIRFRDPSRNVFELVLRPHVAVRRYFPTRDAGITEFSHIGLKTADAARDEAFWGTLFNFRANDWIGLAGLLSFDKVHHRIALFPAPVPGVQHINFQVASIDDIMRSYYFLQDRQVRIVFGPGRHVTSGAYFLYFEGPDGVVYEYSSGVRMVDDAWRPRQLPFCDEAFCAWGSRPDIPEFQS